MTETPTAGAAAGGRTPSGAPGPNSAGRAADADPAAAGRTDASWAPPEPAAGSAPQRTQPRTGPPVVPRVEAVNDPGRASTVPAETTATGWVGWVIYAATMLILVGGFQLFDGFVALFRDELYVVRPDGLAVTIDYTAWGWLQLALGGLLLAIGFALLAGRTWARVLGIVVAVLNAVLHFAFLPAYPFWSMLIITVDVIVIYALAAHGGEIKVARDREYA